jgi:hypothetical protein
MLGCPSASGGFRQEGVFMSSVNQVLCDSELSRTAEMLIKTKGVGAAVYVDMKIEEMKNIRDEANQAYWKNILVEVEKMLYEA